MASGPPALSTNHRRRAPVRSLTGVVSSTLFRNLLRLLADTRHSAGRSTKASRGTQKFCSAAAPLPLSEHAKSNARSTAIRLLLSLRPGLRCATSLLALAVTVAPAKPDDGVRSSEERTARPFVRGESCAWFRTKTVAACSPPFPRTRASPKKSYCYFCCCCRRQLADQESASTSLVGRRFQRAIGSRAKRLENVPETLCFPYYSLPALQVTMQRRSQ